VYPNKELVIVNDGSLDGTSQVISNWVSRNQHAIEVTFVDRGNKGISTTLNELARLAKGEFLRICASDDYILPEGISAQVEYLKKNKTKSAVFGDAVVVDALGERTCESLMADLYRVDKSNYQGDHRMIREIICRWAIGGPVLMIRKTVLEQLGGWSEDLVVEDWDLYLRLVSIGAVGFMENPVGAYRIHGLNTSRTKNVAKRIRNLRDMQLTACRRTTLFEEPYKSLLSAEKNLIAAKIAFLEKRYFLMIRRLANCGILRFSSLRPK
jgi:glycosyltransferase involved in cell wall biosynthesis